MYSGQELYRLMQNLHCWFSIQILHSYVLAVAAGNANQSQPLTENKNMYTCTSAAVIGERLTLVVTGHMYAIHKSADRL